MKLKTKFFGKKRLNRKISLMVALLISLAGLTAEMKAAPGDLDPTFGAGGTVVTVLPDNISPHKMGIQPDGKIVVSGIGFLGVNYSTNFLARYNLNDTLERIFCFTVWLGKR